MTSVFPKRLLRPSVLVARRHASTITVGVRKRRGYGRMWHSQRVSKFHVHRTASVFCLGDHLPRYRQPQSVGSYIPENIVRFRKCFGPWVPNHVEMISVRIRLTHSVRDAGMDAHHPLSQITKFPTLRLRTNPARHIAPGPLCNPRDCLELLRCLGGEL